MAIFADLDGLKNINDTHGHSSGDQALVDISEVLRKSFRESDILGRIGGDEFAVLAMDVSALDGADKMLVARLQEHLQVFNAQAARPYQLSLSVGAALFQPECPRPLEEILEEADARMYEQKRAKKAGQA
jgi:diguanylate cyclase (GGDEF)-like protein